MPRLRRFTAALLLISAVAARAQMAPPPAPPVTSAAAMVDAGLPGVAAAGPPQLYSIGSPTNEEQYYLELMNRARANPVAEAARLATTTDSAVRQSYTYFGVDLALMQTQFAAFSPLPPLSMNSALLDAARGHSQNMLQNNYQGHSGPDGVLSARIAAYLSGANGFSYGENVYSYAKSVFYGHAGFEVDWGGSAATGGMQSPAGHRLNIHGNYREVGVGVVLGSNGSVGPQLVTQDFGLRYDTPPLITGVVYRDFNGNNFYDPGEGIGAVTVSVAGSSYYAVTAASGGYTVPVPAAGNYTVTFSGGSVPTSQQTATAVAASNVKVDYVLPAGPSVLANISTRAVAGTNANVVIGGFIITGTQSKKVMVRAIGPSLGLANKLADPVLELHSSTGALIASNDNWGDAPNASEIVASSIAPTDARESAIEMSLAPGAYTAVLAGARGTGGTAVVEVYDLDRTTDSQLANISTRSSVQTGDGVMIGGVIVVGSSPLKVLIRALGPSIGVAGALADPMLELRDANGGLVLANDNWRTLQASEIAATTIPPTNDSEAALIATLQPASYTAIVRGANSSTGVAIVEVYALK